jgi:hypothetical protein
LSKLFIVFFIYFDFVFSEDSGYLSIVGNVSESEGFTELSEFPSSLSIKDILKPLLEVLFSER